MKLPHRFPFSEGKQKEPARKCRLFRLKTGPETRTQVDGSHDEGMLAGLAPNRASASRPADGPVLDVAELRRARSCFVYDVFWLLSFGLSVSAPALFSRPSFVGPCAMKILLRRSRVAYFLRRFFSALPCGGRGLRRPRASKLASNQKTTGRDAETLAGLHRSPTQDDEMRPRHDCSCRTPRRR
jgi:hypothetical protein